MERTRRRRPQKKRPLENTNHTTNVRRWPTKKRGVQPSHPDHQRLHVRNLLPKTKRRLPMVHPNRTTSTNGITANTNRPLPTRMPPRRRHTSTPQRTTNHRRHVDDRPHPHKRLHHQQTIIKIRIRIHRPPTTHPTTRNTRPHIQNKIRTNHIPPQ